MGMRRKSREIAIQTLYSLIFTTEDTYLKELKWKENYIQKLKEIAEDNNVDENSHIFEFAQDKINDMINNIDKVDKIINDTAINWSVDRIAPIELSILRLAISEIITSDIPTPVIINEAIELTKKFSIEKSKSFINGILDNVCKRRDELNVE